MHEIESLDDVTLCCNCGDIVINFVTLKGYEIASNEDIVSKHVHDSSNCLLCDGCNSEIEQEENFFTISIDYDIQVEIANRLSEDIGGCTYCEGDERAYFVHRFNDDPHDPTSRMDFKDVCGISVSDYLSDKGVPDELINFFAQLIVCKCGFGREPAHPRHNPDGGIFDIYDDIYTKRDVAHFWGFDYEEFSEFGERYGEQFSKVDLIEFRNHLLKFPMLAYVHETGRAIFNALQKHYVAKDYAVLKQEDGPIFRGRTRKKDSGKPFDKEEMWAPPEGLPQHGRYNSVGVPVLYVCDELHAIPYEIHPTHEDVIDIGEFQLKKGELSLFDLGSFDSEFQGFFNEMNEETKLIKKAYLLPNFIGTCCSYIGYDGVKYGGVHKKLEYTNYGLFNIDMEKDMSVLKVRTFEPDFTIKLQEVFSPESHF